MGAIFLAVGLGLIALWIVVRRKSSAIMTWPSSPGRVISSEVVRMRDTNGNFIERPRIVYEYAGGGATHQGNRISFGGPRSVGARKCVARYPAGSTVQVFYDPAKPGSAVLERGGGGGASVLLIVGGVFAIIGAGLILIR